MNGFFSENNLYKIIMTVLSFVLLLPDKAKSYDFQGNSGLKKTAQGTGHADISIFTPGGLASGIGMVINIVLSLLGVVFLILMVYGGYLWMSSSGNEEQVNKAKKIITSAIVGLVITAAAYAITAAVGSYLNLA